MLLNGLVCAIGISGGYVFSVLLQGVNPGAFINGLTVLTGLGELVLAEVKALGGTGGVIVAGPDGDIAWGFNTVGMYRGTASSKGSRIVAIYANELA